MWKCTQCAEGNGESAWDCWKCGRARRRDPRIRLNWLTRWGTTERCEEQGRITSLGTGGCFVQTDREVARGRAVYVLLELPSARILQGEVRYYMERVGFGVEFAGLSDENRDDLRTLVEDFGSAAGGGEA